MKAWRVSLSTKILVGFIAVFATVVTVTGYFQYRAMHREMYSNVEASTSNLVVMVQSLVHEDPNLLHTETLPRAVLRFSQQLPDIADVMIYDLDGNIIADAYPNNFTGSNEYGPRSLLEAGEGSLYYSGGGRKYYRLVRPLLGPYDASRKNNVVGMISIDMQITPIDEQIARNLLRDIGIRVALLSVFALFLYAYARRVFVRPLLQLAAAADHFGKTGSSPPIHIRTGDEMEDLAKSFNRSVEERQRSEDLELARRTADDANRAKGEFLANMSHEIRTPMNGVLGMLELALDTELSRDQRDYVSTARSSAEALVDIINDILDFSKIEAGHFALDSSQFRLGESLADTIRILGHRADQKGLEFAIDIAPDVPDALIGDAGRLRQVISNLVGNAIKFTERGEVVLRVEVDGRDENWAALHFFVVDTGIGIEGANQERVFEAFQQADASTTRQFGGTGLGLPISSRIVTLMGGRLGLKSEPGKGSVFDFTARFWVQSATTATAETRSTLLSPITEALQETSPARIADQSPASIPSRARPLRVLVAEDNAVNQKLAWSILQRAGHIVVVVPNGQQAVDAMSRERFDAVLMDVQMPVMGGFEATRLIRNLEAGLGRRTPIIAVTARAMKGDREACLEAGMDGFVPKPIQSARLLEALELLATGSPPETPLQIAHLSQANEAGPQRVAVEQPSADLDEAALLVVVGGNRALAGELAVLFLDDIEPRMKEINTAVTERDADRLRAGAHALRGSAATMTAHSVAAAAEELETMGRSGLLDGVQRVLEKLNAALAILRPRLVALTGAP
jgi:signal transduction histidine kinase/CheY-like chemotaxis protein/HPt (histidine-containing phosphotransfer) domain-containing protein